MAKRPPLQTLIKRADSAQLRQLVGDLCRLSPENRRYVELLLSPGHEADPTEIIAAACKAIEKKFNTYGERVDLRGARKVVTDTVKVLRGFPLEAAEIKLVYVEIGTNFTLEYGDLYESFYDSLLSMLENFCRDIEREPGMHGYFAEHLQRLRRKARNIGWGYGDQVDFLVGRLADLTD